jgi:hypothetical protein
MLAWERMRPLAFEAAARPLSANAIICLREYTGELLREAKIPAGELGGVSLDEALRILVFEHECLASYARLVDDSDSLADYRAEAAQLGEVDVAVAE